MVYQSGSYKMALSSWLPQNIMQPAWDYTESDSGSSCDSLWEHGQITWFLWAPGPHLEMMG